MNIFSRMDAFFEWILDPEVIFKPVDILINWFDQTGDAFFNFAESSPGLFVFIAIIIMFRVASSYLSK